MHIYRVYFDMCTLEGWSIMWFWCLMLRSFPVDALKGDPGGESKGLRKEEGWVGGQAMHGMGLR